MGLPSTLRAVGRLDMNTEGLILLTTCGDTKRELELPENGAVRRYRARVHGRIDERRLDSVRRGATLDGVRYRPMGIKVESMDRGTNAWLNVTCSEGKRRQVREVMKYAGLTVNRLVRTAFGPYKLRDIPPGAVLEVIPQKLKKKKSGSAASGNKDHRPRPVDGAAGPANDRKAGYGRQGLRNGNHDGSGRLYGDAKWAHLDKTKKHRPRSAAVTR